MTAGQLGHVERLFVVVGVHGVVLVAAVEVALGERRAVGAERVHPG